MATVEPTSRRSQRDGEKTRLLELGPAVRLEEDAASDGMGQAVDRDPVAGLAGGPAQELPGALGVLGQEPVEHAEREPARLELRLRVEPGRDLEIAGGALAPGRGPEPALDGGRERPAHAIQTADPRGDALGASQVLGVGQLPEAGRQRVGECIGVGDEVGQTRAQRLGGRSAFGDEGHRPGRHR